jgi:hypothetical protein
MRRPPDQAGARNPRLPLPVRRGGAAQGRRLEALGLLAVALSAGLARPLAEVSPVHRVAPRSLYPANAPHAEWEDEWVDLGGEG